MKHVQQCEHCKRGEMTLHYILIDAITRMAKAWFNSHACKSMGAVYQCRVAT